MTYDAIDPGQQLLGLMDWWQTCWPIVSCLLNLTCKNKILLNFDQVSLKCRLQKSWNTYFVQGGWGVGCGCGDVGVWVSFPSEYFTITDRDWCSETTVRTPITVTTNKSWRIRLNVKSVSVFWIHIRRGTCYIAMVSARQKLLTKPNFTQVKTHKRTH